ncbi:MAG TPA: diguanylate cyclase [Longimicrobiales bacterium]
MEREAELSSAAAAAVWAAAAGIIACPTEAAVHAAIARLPESRTGVVGLEYVPASTLAYSVAPAPKHAAAVVCRGRVVGELRAAGECSSGAAAAVLPVLAELMGTAVDRIRALEDCRRLNEGLELDRVYFEQLFDASPEAIVVLDGEDRVARVNREFERLFGYTSSEAQGRTINDLIVPSELQSSAISLTRDVAAGRSVHAEAVRRRKDGTLLRVAIRGTPVVVQGDQVAVYGIYRDITAQKEAEEALRRLSTTDELTGLFNRRGFFLLAEQQLRLAARRHAELLLLFIDIDEFKQINDAHGHLEGDRVLSDVGNVLRSCFRESDIVSRMGDVSGVLARMGGDEFVLLAIDAGTRGEEILTERLHERVRQYNADSGRPYTLSVSVGALRFAPGPDVTIDSLIATADRLMYSQKRHWPKG